MKFTLDKRLFSKVLEIIGSHASKVSQLYGCAYVEAVGGFVHFTAGDNMTGATATVALVLEREGVAAIPLEMLAEIVGSFPAGDVVLDFSGDQAKLSSGKFRATIKTLDADGYAVAPVATGVEFDLDYSELVSAVDGVAYAAQVGLSTFQSHVHITTNGKLMLEAASQAKFARASVGHNGDEEETAEDALVPAVSMIKMVRSLSLVDSTQPVKAVISESRITFALDGREVSISLYVATAGLKFPDMDRLLKQLKTKASAKVSNDQLMAALKMILAVNRQNGIERVIFQLADDEFRLEAYAGQAGEAASEVPADEVNGKFRVVLNGDFLRQTLEHLGSLVTVLYSGDDKPITLTDSVSGLRLISPMV